MAWEHVSIERRGRIAIVRFSRGNKANALSRRLMQELREAAIELDADPDLSAVVLTGTPKVFSMGYDLEDARAILEASLAERRLAQRLGPDLSRAWEELEPMVIVAIEGWCVGGGVALAVAGDLRVAGRTGRFYVPEIERGMNMSWGSLPRIVNLIGPAKAKRLVVLAEKLDAERALDWGLIDEVAPEGEVLGAALAMAERVAALPPVQVRMCKLGINAAAKALNQATAALDRDQYLLAQTSADHREGVLSFLEKRPPRYTGG